MLSLDALERLSRYAGGDLGENERRRFEAELRTDPELARALEHCRLLDQMMSELGAEPATDRDERLIQRVVRGRLSRRWRWVAAAAAVLIAAGIGAVFEFGPSSKPLPTIQAEKRSGPASRGSVILFSGAQTHPDGEGGLVLDEGGLVVDGQARITANGTRLSINGLAAVTTEPGDAFAHVKRGLRSVPERKDIQMRFSSWSGPRVIVGAASVALLVATGTAEARDPRGEMTFVKAGEAWSPRTSSTAVVADAERGRPPSSPSTSEVAAKTETLREALHKSLPAFTRCYQQGLAQDPSLEGSVIAHLTLIAGPDGKGKVAEATIDKDYSIANPFVVSCVLQELGGLTVPPPSNETSQVTLPIYFRHGEDGQDPSVQFSVFSDAAKVAPPPAPTEQVVAVGNAHVRGARDAKVTVVEFSDPECPYCGRAHESINLLYMELGDRVRFATKFAPMPFHRRAPTAVAAAFAAGEQGKFWEYVDALFSHPDALDRRGLERMAAQLGLDMKGFGEALDGNRFKPAIEAEQSQAKTLGVSGVPTFFINGRALVGARPIEEFREQILEALSESR